MSVRRGDRGNSISAGFGAYTPVSDGSVRVFVDPDEGLDLRDGLLSVEVRNNRIYLSQDSYGLVDALMRTPESNVRRVERTRYASDEMTAGMIMASVGFLTTFFLRGVFSDDNTFTDPVGLGLLALTVAPLDVGFGPLGSEIEYGK